MYLAIDVGGTKTLLAAFSADGKVLHEYKIPTSQDYIQFKKDLAIAISSQFSGYSFTSVCCGLPGMQIDRAAGTVPSFGNLPWQNVAIKQDIQALFNPNIPTYIENDAKLAGLHEALLNKAQYHRVLYITLGTGIGVAFIENGVLDLSWSDEGGHDISIDQDGQTIGWESVASGHALVAKYGKTASEITDSSIWKSYAHNIALGLSGLIVKAQPDAVIIGGGVGQYLDRFKDSLTQELSQSLAAVPPIVEADKPQEAVIYGCFDYIKQTVE